MALSSQPSGQLVRNYLKSLGYDDKQIGFNPTSKTVTLNNNDFFKPTTINNGRAYGTQDQLDNAYNTYQYRQGQKTSNDLLSRYRAAIDQPVQQQQFSYDPNSDPQYQAALRQAQSNAQQATGNAIASLNARGIDTSTVASDRAAQIQQQALGQVTDQVLPQLMQQAYQRFENQQQMNYQRQQDQNNAILNLLGITNQQNQQYIDNQANRRNENLQAALAVGDATGRAVTPQMDASGLFRQAANPSTPLNLAGEQFQHGVNQDEFANQLARDNYNLNARQTNASIANMNADNARQNDSAAQQRFLDIWQLTNSAPADYPEYGIKKGDPYPTSAETPQYNGVSADQIYQAAKSRFTDPDSGRIPQDPVTKEKIYLQVGQSGLPDGQDTQVMSMLGLSAQDILNFDKKYGVTGG